MFNKLSEGGSWLFRNLGYASLGAILEFALGHLQWLNARVLPWFFYATTLALVLVILVVLPFSAFRRCRGFSALAANAASYVFFATLLMWAVLLTLGLWGKWPVVIGSFMMIIGVVPVAMVATYSTGVWGTVIQLVVLTILTIGSRAFARWIGNRTVAPVRIREYSAVR